MGPLLLRRGEVPPPPADFKGVVRNFYEGHLTKEELDARRARESQDAEAGQGVVVPGSDKKVVDRNSSNNGEEVTEPTHTTTPHQSLIGPKPNAKWYSGAGLWYLFKWLLLGGVDRDIVSSQQDKSIVAGDIEEIHSHATHFDNRTSIPSSRS
jgi:sodium-dependent phosphate transporter